MRTTITLDDDLLASAKEFAGDIDTPSLIRLALKSYIEREASRRLILLGGTQPDFEVPPRRRPAS